MSKDPPSIMLGIIGCGRIASTHLRVLAKTPHVEVIAAADVEVDRVESLSHRFQIPHRYTDYQALLDNPDINAVAILVPTMHHAEIGRAALEARKHVFLEKPMAFTLDECDQLADLASRSDRKAMIGFNRRFHPFAMKSREIVGNGVLGKVEALNSVDTSSIRSAPSTPDWRIKRGAGGGKLFEGAPHHFDLWRVLLQDEVEEVFVIEREEAFDSERIEDAVNTTTVVSARTFDGAMVSALFSTDTARRSEVELFGREGTLRADFFHFDGLTLQLTVDRGLGRRSKFRNRLLETYRALRYLPRALHRYGIFEASYINEWRHFIDAVRYGRPVLCSFEDGRRAVQIALAAIKSATIGKPVRVEDAPRSMAAAEGRT